jgi:hypothetical protein
MTIDEIEGWTALIIGTALMVLGAFMIWSTYHPSKLSDWIFSKIMGKKTKVR